MHISEINIYPIKSLRGISLSESKFERRGLQFDRRWLLVDAKNQFLTQREFPKMATLAVEITNDSLQISHSGEKFQVPLTLHTNESLRVKIWSNGVKAHVYENAVNEFFSDALQTNCKLVKMPEETYRKVSYFYAVHKEDVVSFADAYPFLLIGENSLANLNGKLEQQVPMNRFRPNFVVEGSAPFEEDSWKKIKIGGEVFHLVKPCARCVMTTIEQQTGEKQGVEPLRTLASYRIPKRSVKKKILFGQNLISESGEGIVRVGDKIEILELNKSTRAFI